MFIFFLIFWPFVALAKVLSDLSDSSHDEPVNSYQMPTLNWTQGLTVEQ